MITNNFTSQTDLQIIEYNEEAHNHTGNPVAAANRVIDHRARVLAATTTEATRTIVQQSANHLSTADALIVLPTRRTQNTSRNVQSQRRAKRSRIELAIPTTIAFEIPEELRSMPNGENFILGDWTNEEGTERILIMGNF